MKISRVFVRFSNVSHKPFIEEKNVWNKSCKEKWITLYVQYTFSTSLTGCENQEVLGCAYISELQKSTFCFPDTPEDYRRLILDYN
jgi:hypothetical protein